MKQASSKTDNLSSKIHTIRGIKVILDHDLAGLYEVETKQLKRQVNRNIERFPKDFLFQLTSTETENLWCQIGTTNISEKTQDKITWSR
ncbi:MAG: ORF6N domain-containing protein [bacterium]|nr:ORF6N domain-containing protein [bacterium]